MYIGVQDPVSKKKKKSTTNIKKLKTNNEIMRIKLWGVYVENWK